MSSLTLVYDGECGFCQGWADWVHRRDVNGQIRLMTCQSDERRERLPQIREEDCLKALHVVFPDSRLFSGADAAPHILDVLPRWRWCSFLFRIPGALLLARPIYRFIARQRRNPGCNIRRNK